MTALSFDELSERISERMHRAMKESRMSKADKKHADLVATNLHRTLTQIILDGKFTVDLAQKELDRLRDAMVSGAVSAESIKNGIVVFDGLAQRLAMTSDNLDYPTDRNRARDLLVTYARALHR